MTISAKISKNISRNSVVSAPSVASFTSRYGNPAVDYRGAHVRAHCRHAATVLAISGCIDATNSDRLTRDAARFILPDKPFIIDLSAVTAFSAQVAQWVSTLGDLCAVEGVDWAVVVSDISPWNLWETMTGTSLPLAGSVAQALHEFDDAISHRRQLLLPLLSKTA